MSKHAHYRTLHYTLSDLGVRKRYHSEFAAEDAERVFEQVCRDLVADQEAQPA